MDSGPDPDPTPSARPRGRRRKEAPEDEAATTGRTAAEAPPARPPLAKATPTASTRSTHAHGHAHGGEVAIHASRGSRITLLVLTLALLAATVAGLVVLWPGSSTTSAEQQLLAPGVEVVHVTVTEIPADRAPDQNTMVQAEGTSDPIDGRIVTVQVPPEIAVSGLHVGDRLRVLSVADAGGTGAEDQGLDTGEDIVPGQVASDGGGALAPDDLGGQEVSDAGGADQRQAPTEGSGSPDAAPEVFYYFDADREVPLGILLVLYLVVVALVARGRGLRAVVGLVAGVAVIVLFMFPAILGGQDPVLVALVGGSAMIFPCVYFAHGISVRTTTAILGTFGGLAVTVVLALVAGRPAGMTGTDGDAAMLLFGQSPTLSLSAIFLAGVVISGLGALNDVTITQASSAWELRAAMPEASRWEVFTATMRIGRDHIASTVYTLAYAYIGSALPTLLVASTIERPLLDTLTSGEIASEVFRTLVASTGLVLAIPLTTAIAAMLASVGTPRRNRRQELAERLARF